MSKYNASGQSATLVEVVKGIYRPSSGPSQWLDRLTAEASRLPGWHGVVSRIVDTNLGQTLGPYAIHGVSENVRRLFRAHEARSAHRVDFLVSNRGALRSTRQALERAAGDAYLEKMKAHFECSDVHDMLHLTATDGDGAWVTLGFLAHADSPSPWHPRACAAAHEHLATGLRLQRRTLALARWLAPDSAREALELPDSPPEVVAQRRLQAERAGLRAAVRRLETELPSGGRIRAETVWKGVLDGTWSVLDQHDHDSRRYVVVVRSPGGSRDPRALSHREAQVAALAAEGHSDKWIGHVLGITRSTVASQLASALHKLDLPSRAWLARLFRSCTS